MISSMSYTGSIPFKRVIPQGRFRHAHSNNNTEVAFLPLSLSWSHHLRIPERGFQRAKKTRYHLKEKNGDMLAMPILSDNNGGSLWTIPLTANIPEQKERYLS